MCLIVKSAPKIAKKDITCYKIVTYVPFLTDDRYFSHFVGCFIQYGDKICNYVMEDSHLKHIEDYIDSSGIINEGVIHSYKYLNDALAFKKKYEEATLFKCVIPSGTEYVSGLNHLDLTSGYGSKSIKFIKKIS